MVTSVVRLLRSGVNRMTVRMATGTVVFEPAAMSKRPPLPVGSDDAGLERTFCPPFGVSGVLFPLAACAAPRKVVSKDAAGRVRTFGSDS